MSIFINFAELYGSGGSFSRQEVIENGGVTTIYGGYAPVADTGADTDALSGWLIRRLVVTESGSTQSIQCTWANGSWNGRASLDYTYQMP